MAKKSRLKKDAFDWVKDTSEETAPGAKKDADKPASKSKPPQKKDGKKTTPSPKERKPEVAQEPPSPHRPGTGERRVFIQYRKNGNIIAMMEAGAGAKNPFLSMPADASVEEFLLSGKEFSGQSLVDIHRNYRVDTSGKKPKLVLKK